MSTHTWRRGPGVLLALSLLASAAWAQAPGEIRLTPDQFDLAGGGAGAGTSGVTGIRTMILKGDPTGTGLYTILLYVPAHTRIAAHRHPDDRVATVVSGTWYFGYGSAFDATALRALPVGSYYTEPPDVDHFAETRDTAVLVQITGVGPTGTTYVRTEDDPR